MISLLGIVIGLALFILLAYMGYNTIIVAIASAMVVAVFGGMNPFVALTEAFMPKTVGFMQGYFLIFLFSALFARFMGDSGAAPSIAVKVARIAKKAKNPDMQRWLAVMVLPLIQLILTYGGVNVFVVVFILVAIARSLFKDLNIPWWMGIPTWKRGPMLGEHTEEVLKEIGYTDEQIKAMEEKKAAVQIDTTQFKHLDEEM